MLSSPASANRRRRRSDGLQRVWRNRVRRTVEGSLQAFARYDLAGIAQEQFEEIRFLASDGEQLSVDFCLPAGRVEGDIADLEDDWVAPAGAADQRAQRAAISSTSAGLTR